MEVITCNNCINLKETQLVVGVRDEQNYTVQTPEGPALIRRFHLEATRGHYSVQYRFSNESGKVWHVGLLCQVLKLLL